MLDMKDTERKTYYIMIEGEWIATYDYNSYKFDVELNGDELKAICKFKYLSVADSTTNTNAQKWIIDNPDGYNYIQVLYKLK